MQQGEYADGQGDDDRQGGQDEDAQDDVDLALVGGQGVEDVELVGARAGQLNLGAHEDAGRDLVGVGGPDAHGLPLGASLSHGLAHLGRDEPAHLFVLDLVDA